MKLKMFILGLGIIFSQSSFATGSFTCKAETWKWTTVEISGCVPHTIPALCSDVTILKNKKGMMIVKKTDVLSFYISDNFLGLTVMDSNYSDTIVSLEYFGPNDNKNSLIIKSPQGTTYKFKDVSCEID